MASRRRIGVSRSVALSLAALLVLTGAMFMVTTFQQDSQEWKLVEDESVDLLKVFSTAANYSASEDPAVVFTFDEESSTYSLEVTGGDIKATSGKFQTYAFVFADGFDFSKDYKFVISSSLTLPEFGYIANDTYTKMISLDSAEDTENSVYVTSVELYDQYMSDLSYKDGFSFSAGYSTSSASFVADSVSFQLYELHTDNTGSIAAGITGLVLIVMGVFAMPMHNILRRR